MKNSPAIAMVLHDCLGQTQNYVGIALRNIFPVHKGVRATHASPLRDETTADYFMRYYQREGIGLLVKMLKYIIDP